MKIRPGKATQVVVAVAAGSLLAFAAGAQPPRGERDGSRMLQRLPVHQALDADADGALSAEEIANASQALARLDEDMSGDLDALELRPERPDRSGAGAPPSGERRGRGGRSAGGPGGAGGAPGSRLFDAVPVLSALDADGDLSISAAEIAAAPIALATLDADGNGELAGAEIAPRLGSRPGRGAPRG